MDKKQLKGIFAGIGYFLLYACLMMVFQMLYTFVIMGISYISGTRKEMDFMSFANNNLLTAALLTIVSVGVIFYLIFKRRGKSVKIEWKLLPFTSKALVISVIAAVAYSVIFSLLANYISPEGANPIFRSANYYSGIAPGLGFFLMLLNLLVAAPVVEEIVMRHRECRGEQISHHYQFAALRFDACLGGWTHIGNRRCTDGTGFCTHLCKDK